MGRNQDELPVYERIKNSIRHRIEIEELPEGTRIPSEHQLARELGVSRNQTRQAMHELALEGFIVRRRGSGSFVAPAAANVSSVNVAGSTQTVALVFPRYIARFCRQVVDGFLQRMAQEGRPTIAYNIEEPDEEGELRILQTVAESGIAGLAAWIEHDTPETRSILASMRTKRLPVILMDRQLEGLGIDFVGSDHELLGYRLTAALLQRGHRQIGFAGASVHDSPSSMDLRLKGYQRAVQEAGIDPDPRLCIDKNRLYANPAAEVTPLMGLRNSPTAFCCAHDRAARLLLQELRRLDYGVPEHVELAVVDDGYPPEDRRIPALTIAQQAGPIGIESAEVLLARMASPDAPVQCRQIEPGPLKEDEVEPDAVQIATREESVRSAGQTLV